jgi:hypothetical protein
VSKKQSAALLLLTPDARQFLQNSGVEGMGNAKNESRALPAMVSHTNRSLLRRSGFIEERVFTKSSHLTPADRHWIIKSMGVYDYEGLLDVEDVLNISFVYESIAHDNYYSVLIDERSAGKKQCRAALWRSFELRRLLPFPDDPLRFFHVLHTSAIGYVSGHKEGLRRWMMDNWMHLIAPVIPGTDWDNYSLSQMYGCWLRLIREYLPCEDATEKNMPPIQDVLDQLKMERCIYEPSYIEKLSPEEKNPVICHLMATVEWLRATELQISNANSGIVNHYFYLARSAAARSGDVDMENALVWLQLAAADMRRSEP